MGSCLSNNESAEPGEKKANTEIGHGMHTAAAEEKKELKLLLLGTGSSGKSTLFKSLKLVNGQQFKGREQNDTRNVIRQNLVHSIGVLLIKSETLSQANPAEFGSCAVPWQDDKKIMDNIMIIKKYGDDSCTFGDDENIDDNDLKELAEAISYLWSIQAVKNTFDARGGRFSFYENMDYFFNKTLEVFKPDYTPSDQDVLKARVRTTGVVTTQYEQDNNIFKIYDVGGQRNERKKWIHSFESVSAVIFVAALNHYNCVLFEAETTNAMHEALDLFNEIVNCKYFRNSEMILFLNKDDLFREFLGTGHTLDDCFGPKFGWKGEAWDGPNYVVKPDKKWDKDEEFEVCYEAAREFILNQFLKLKKIPTKGIYSHITTGCDTKVVENVFMDVQNIVVKANLRRGGLIV